ncbi:MAG: hypothetical protein LBE98_03475 [Puniceicoccales bacterium]|nr:hypothetical protein [Puniceicoccales bacterium]
MTLIHKNISVLGVEPPGSGPGSQPDLEEPGAGSTSGEGGEVAGKVAGANPECVVPPVNPFNSIIVFHSGDGIDASNGVGNLQFGDLNSISDLLDGSNKYIQKCSLNDILFLVMLILIKATSEQRQSRFESMSTQRAVSAMVSTAVFELKIAEAKATYEKEMKAAELKMVMAIVSIVCAVLSIIAAVAGAIGQAASGAVKAIANAIENVAKVISTILNIVAPLVQGLVGLQIAEKGRTAAFMRAEIALMQTFFENTMQRVRNMQAAYSASQRNITSSLQSMQEILEKKQSTRLSVARNI